MKANTWCRGLAVATLSGLLLAGCGGGGGSDESAPPPDPLPPAGASRWAAVEVDEGADGTVDRVTRHVYDTQGRRAGQRSFVVIDGEEAAEPTSERLWTFDRWSRIVGLVERDASRSPAVTVTTTYAYGPDGRLARRLRAYDWGSEDTRYTWRDGRIAEETTVRSNSTDVGMRQYTYDSSGRVSSTTQQRPYEEAAQYQWRADGRPASMRVSSGFLASYVFVDDADGRHVTTHYNDDGIYFLDAHLTYDARGRLQVLETGEPQDGAEFAPSVRTRYRWEPGPCQPLVMPGGPPHIDSPMAGQVSADNVSFGCAP